MTSKNQLRITELKDEVSNLQGVIEGLVADAQKDITERERELAAKLDECLQANRELALELKKKNEVMKIAYQRYLKSENTIKRLNERVAELTKPKIFF